jgi:hypothetical protein
MTGAVAVVVPFGGRARLPLLDATLAALRRCGGEHQLIVSEHGTTACGHDVAARWGADHVFNWGDGGFDKARALNLGPT